ncbi:MAG: S41 family peptidase [Fimbriimonas sp.]
MKSRIGLLALFLTCTSLSFADTIIGARNLALSPDGSRLAFSYLGDIWVVPATGGQATPVTDNVEMDDLPVWSPDGTKLAFASNRFGSNDVFVVNANGGRPKRITFFSGPDVPSSWSADGKSVLLARTLDNAYRGLYSVEVESGKIKQLLVDNFATGSPQASPDGQRVVFTRIGFPWTRPRYQGSAASQLWTLDTKTGARKELRNNGYQHLWPQVSASGIYAVTMTDPVPSSSTLNPDGSFKSVGKIQFTVGGTPNVYQIDLGGKAKRLTSFAGDGTRFLTAARDGKSLAFERDGDVYVLPAGGEPKKIAITASIDDKISTEERVVLTEGASSPTLSADGNTLVFTAASELWSVPVKKGEGPNKDDATQLTEWAGLDDQALFVPDGKAVFFVSDRDGASKLYRLDLATKKTTRITNEEANVEDLVLTPDRKFVAFQLYGKNGGIYKVPVEGGTPTVVLARPGRSNLDFQFSPDGRYLAYVEALLGSGFYYWDAGNNVIILDTTTGKKVNVTQLNARNGAPIWSPDGKYLVFTSNRGGTDALYYLPLQPEDLRPNEIKPKFEKPKETPKVEIDFDEIETRARRVIDGAVQAFAFDSEDGSLYYIGADGVSKADYSGENPRRVTGPSQSADLSFDNKTLTVVQAGRVSLINAKAPNFPATPVTFRADFTRDLQKTRQAAFQQFWRANNDGFYDPNFHGRDWDALKAKYEKFLPSVGHRNEMATVLGMMVGELEASHTEVSAAPGGAAGQTSAHLGFTFDYSYDGPGIKIKEVPKRAPGSYAKTKLSSGEIVLKINGKDVGVNEGLYRDVLNEQVGREVTLTVQGADGKSREVKYRAISGGEFNGIVSSNRLDWNRKYVETKSGGKVGYAQIAAMNEPSLQRFQQQVWQFAQEKKGFIIDVRGNGGGNTADRIIDILERQRNMQYVPRDESRILGPGQVLDMPIVVIMGENSFSNAEMFPQAMKTRGLAKLVGRRTPGYVIYTGGLPLVDGTVGRMPGTGVWRLDGTSLENNGVVPDFDVALSPDQFFGGVIDPQLDKAIAVLLQGR